MTTPEKIGNNVCKLREAKGWTQADVADKAGINTNTYAKIERGVQTPSIPMLEKLAEVFEVDIDVLLKFDK